MTEPREVLPGRFYMLTRRCIQRQFLLRPDKETNNAFVYCLAEAAQRFEIELIAAQQMSNHHHTTLFDRHGRIVEFTAHFHKMLAKCQNALRGRWDHVWSGGGPNDLLLVDTVDVLDKAVYTATNPVLEHLVDRVHHWPGAPTVRAMLDQKPIVAWRPAHFFRDCGPMPATVELRFTVPPELGDTAQVLEHLRRRIEEVELRQAEVRAKEGRRLLGRRAVLRQSWSAAPTTFEVRRGITPRIAAKSKWSRLAALSRNAEFVKAYRAARKLWLGGLPSVFPPGTYWLARFAGVPVGHA